MLFGTSECGRPRKSSSSSGRRTSSASGMQASDEHNYVQQHGVTHNYVVVLSWLREHVAIQNCIGRI